MKGLRKIQRLGILTVVAMMVVLLVSPTVSAFWWHHTNPSIADHSLLKNPPWPWLQDTEVDLYIQNSQTVKDDYSQFSGMPAPGEQVSKVPGKFFIWTCRFEIRAEHTGFGAPDHVSACMARVYLHWYFCPTWLDGSDPSNYNLLHSNWDQVTSYYDENNKIEGLLHGIHQNHQPVIGEHYAAQIRTWTYWYNDNTDQWEEESFSIHLMFYEIVP